MRFTWAIDVGRYRTTAGLVRESAIGSAVDAVIDAQAAVMRQLTQDLVDQRIALSAWQVQMMQSIKTVHLVGLSVANGGWGSLDQSDFGWVGQRVREQYQFLRAFAADIASGKQPLNGTLLARAEMYAQAGRATHRAAQQRLAEQRSLQQEKSNLGAADHCALCLSEAAKGWQPIGSLIPCGSRTCLSRCHCWFSYRAA